MYYMYFFRQSLTMASCRSGELLACLYCQVGLPSSITQEQYIDHIRVNYSWSLVSDIYRTETCLFKVKHGVSASAEVKRALVHLTQSKEKNPRLKRSAATELPQPPPCPKTNFHFQTVVDGRFPWMSCNIFMFLLCRRLLFHWGSETKVA